jgi:hypothetical protein
MIEFSSEVEASHKHFDEFFEEWGQPFDQRLACRKQEGGAAKTEGVQGTDSGSKPYIPASILPSLFEIEIGEVDPLS